MAYEQEWEYGGPEEFPANFDTIVHFIKEVVDLDKASKQMGKPQSLWSYVAEVILDIPSSKLEEITRNCTSDDERLEKVVKVWMLRCPYASRRWLVWSFMHEEHLQVESYPEWCESVTDATLTEHFLYQVLSILSVQHLETCLEIPEEPDKKAARNSFDWKVKPYSDLPDSDSDDDYQQTDQEKKEAAIEMWLQNSPFASWDYLAGMMYDRDQPEVIENIKKSVTFVPEPTLTVANLCTVFKSVNFEEYRTILTLTYQLHISHAQLREIMDRYSDPSDHMTQLMKLYLENHPTPSWRQVAYALYFLGEYEAVKTVQRKYLRSRDPLTSLQQLCVDAISDSINSSDDVDSLPLPKKMRTLIAKHTI